MSNPSTPSNAAVRTGVWSKLPSIAWVGIFLLGMASIIGFFIGLIWVVSHVEGFMSVVFLLIGIPLFFKLAKGQKLNSLALGGIILFYALMGMALDQTGNALYNKPLDLLCPKDTSIHRSVDVLHPLPGRTDFIQDYSCYNREGTRVSEIWILHVVGLRFAEYLILAYLLYGIGKLYFWLRGEERKA